MFLHYTQYLLSKIKDQFRSRFLTLRVQHLMLLFSLTWDTKSITSLYLLVFLLLYLLGCWPAIWQPNNIFWICCSSQFYLYKKNFFHFILRELKVILNQSKCVLFSLVDINHALRNKLLKIFFGRWKHYMVILSLHRLEKML